MTIEQEIEQVEQIFESKSAKKLKEFFDKELKNINKLIKDKLTQYEVPDSCVVLNISNYKSEKTEKPVFVSTGNGFMILSKENN